MLIVNTKTRRFEMRMTEADYAELSRQSERTKRSKREIMYSAWKGLVVCEAPPADYFTLITELRRVGTNLNQLVKTANAVGFIDAPLLRKLADELHRTDRMLWEAIGVKS